MKDPQDENQEEMFDANTRIVAIKYFYFESQARLYAARLEESGIKCFISNSNTGTVIPVGEGSIGLHVKADDLKLARQIVKKLDVQALTKVANEDFRDADKDDIAYERQLHEQASPRFNYFAFFFLLTILALLGFYYLNAKSSGHSFWFQ